MWNIIGYIFLYLLLLWFVNVLEKIKDILSDIRDKISSLDLKVSNVEPVLLDSIERKLEDIKDAIEENRTITE